MPIRFFVPLPGPFVYVRRSRAERELARQARVQRRLRYAAMSENEQTWRAFGWLIALWAILLLPAWHASVKWGVLVTSVAVWHVLREVAMELDRRRALRGDAEPEK